MKPLKKIIILPLVVLLSLPLYAVDVKIKNLARLESVRENQLVGYGIVTGLSGSGDSRRIYFTIQSIVNMLKKFGIILDKTNFQVDNSAAVMVTATVPAFSNPGDKIDVIVSSIGDADDLTGGVLLQTPLIGANGKVYAMAQGPVSIGGMNPRFAGKNIIKYHQTTARIPNGAILEKEIKTQFSDGNTLKYALNNPDFTTAAKMAQVINKKFNSIIAYALSAKNVEIKIPAQYKKNIVELIAQIENLSLEPSNIAKIVISERTGTIIMGNDIKIDPVAVSHGNLNVKVMKKTKGLGASATALEATQVQIKESQQKIILFPPTTTVNDLIKSLNALGATPRDVISILQAIKKSGALHAEIEVI